MKSKEEIIHIEKLKKSVAVKILTSIFFVVLAALIIFLGFLSSGTFLGGWFTVTSVILIILIFISAPKVFIITDRQIVLQANVEVTTIMLDDIVEIEQLGKCSSFRFIPLYASHFIFGHFGYFFDRREKSVVKLYCTSLNDCIEVTTKNKRRYVISVPYDSEIIKIKEANHTA